MAASGPKPVKTPWNNPSAIGASADGTLVVASGDTGRLARLDVITWKLDAWPSAEGFVTSIAVSPDGSRVGIAATGPSGEVSAPRIELRSADGAIVSTVETAAGALGRGNAQLAWSPSGTRIVAVIGGTTEHEFSHLALVELGSSAVRHVELGSARSVAACFVDDETLLVFASGDDLEAAYRVSASTGVSTKLDAPGASQPGTLSRFDARHFLLVTLWSGWSLVDADGNRRASGARGSLPTPDGLRLVSASGRDVVYISLAGEEGPVFKAKKRVERIAFGGGHLLLLEGGSPGQIEIVPND